MSAKSLTPSPPRSYPLDPMNTLSNTISKLEALNLSSSSSSSTSSAPPSSSSILSWSSASSFASLHIHELAMILSQPLLLKPPSAAAQRKENGSPFRLDATGSPRSPPFLLLLLLLYLLYLLPSPCQTTHLLCQRRISGDLCCGLPLRRSPRGAHLRP